MAHIYHAQSNTRLLTEIEYSSLSFTLHTFGVFLYEYASITGQIIRLDKLVPLPQIIACFGGFCARVLYLCYEQCKS